MGEKIAVWDRPEGRYWCYYQYLMEWTPVFGPVYRVVDMDSDEGKEITFG